MRILIDAVAARTGGGPVRIRELARGLPRIRPEHQFLFAVHPDFTSGVMESAPDAGVISPPRGLDRPPFRLVWEHAWLPRSTSAWRPDVVFGPFNVVPTRWPARRPRLAVLVSNLAPYAPEVTRMYRGRGAGRLRLLRSLTDHSLRRADRIFLLSRQAVDLIPPGILGDRAEVIPMGVPPPAEPTTVSGLPPSVPYFLIATDLLRYKGIEVALRALALLPSDPAVTLVVCGRPMEPAYVRSLRSEAHRLGVTARVRWLGSVGHGEILQLMHGAVGCIVPSRFENQSRVPVEAMSQGTPVVASDVPAFREACGDAALYFRLDEPHTLAGHVERLLRDSALRDDRVRAGRDRVRSLSPLSASQRILETLERLT